MKVTIDAVGRIVLPKPLRDALGLVPGAGVVITQYGAGLDLIPDSRTARLEREESGRLVATSPTVVTCDAVFSLIDAGRR